MACSAKRRITSRKESKCACRCPLFQPSSPVCCIRRDVDYVVRTGDRQYLDVEYFLREEASSGKQPQALSFKVWRYCSKISILVTWHGSRDLFLGSLRDN